MKLTKKGRRVLIIVAAVVVIAAASVTLLTTGILSSIFGPKHITVRVGYSSYAYPPLHFRNSDGVLVGLDIDLARAAGELMNATMEFVPIDWSNREELLVSGEIDVLWGGLERASLDTQKVAFTRSYLQSNIILLMEADRDYAQFDDLNGLSVCALNFTPAFYYMQVLNRDIIKSRRSFSPPEYVELLGTLSSQEYDCMITDVSFASFFIQATGGEYRSSEPLMGSSYAVGVSVENKALFDKLQSALDHLVSSGEVNRLRDRWIVNP